MYTYIPLRYRDLYHVDIFIYYTAICMYLLICMYVCDLYERTRISMCVHKKVHAYIYIHTHADTERYI